MQCKKLLSDDIYRNELFKECNHVIDNDWRWIHRFKEIESLLNVSMFSDIPGKYKILEPVFVSSEVHTISELVSIKKLKKVKRELIKILPYFLAKKYL